MEDGKRERGVNKRFPWPCRNQSGASAKVDPRPKTIMFHSAGRTSLSVSELLNLKGGKYHNQQPANELEAWSSSEDVDAASQSEHSEAQAAGWGRL
jgi:hypothetical protein